MSELQDPSSLTQTAPGGAPGNRNQGKDHLASRIFGDVIGHITIPYTMKSGKGSHPRLTPGESGSEGV